MLDHVFSGRGMSVNWCTTIWWS